MSKKKRKAKKKDRRGRKKRRRKRSPRDILDEKLAQLPPSPGVYIMKDSAGKEIYVGKAKSLRKRVRQYFTRGKTRDAKTQVMLTHLTDVDWVETESEVEALLLESRLIKDLQPVYNILFRSDASYPLVEITWGEDFPRVFVSRERGHKGSKYYGPFVNVTELRTALALTRRIFRFRTCTRKIASGKRKKRYTRPCLDHYIGLCTAPCSGRISRPEYRASVRRLTTFLQGSRAEVIRTLKHDMLAARERLDYEEAARLRDAISAVESLSRCGSLDSGIEPSVPRIDPAAGCRALKRILGLEHTPRTIEGIDVASLSGKEATGSVVTFSDGTPVRGGYRRFRVKTVKSVDDYAMIREVVHRRYSRVLREDEDAMPDVILIDGGAGHLRAASGVLDELGSRATVVSLSKETEAVHTVKNAGGITPSRRNPGLKLLQYVRDEAHRFARHYHHILRRKAVFGK